MDALSEVFRVVRLESAVFFNAAFSAPWCFRSPQSSSVMRTIDPAAETLIVFHLVTHGECVVHIDGEDASPQLLRAGDIVIFPHGDAHRMASEAHVAPAPPTDLRTLLSRRPRQLRYGGGGLPTKFICGYLTCDPRLCRPIFDGMPRILTVSLRTGGSSDWLEASIQYAVGEAASPRPGGEGVLAKLSEVLFIEALRRYIASLPTNQTGWLAGLRCRITGRALSLIHERPCSGWTLDLLAREAGTSRTVLSERFLYYVGQSPMQYLQRWRLALAASLLKGSSLTMQQVAEQVGYESDTAFSRAFRREFGAPPARWRSTQVSLIA